MHPINAFPLPGFLYLGLNIATLPRASRQRMLLTAHDRALHDPETF